MTDIPPPFDALWFQLLVGFITGISLGSFITMLSYRLPKHLSIILPPSHCPSCKTSLQARDLVPVFSWLVMRGKCRFCDVSFGARYVMIEIITGIVCAGAFGLMGFRPMLAALLLGIVILISAVTIIIEHKPYNG